jgi:TRAP transporter 4TM/12TM fusion protein
MPSWMTVTKQSIGVGRIRHHSFWALVFLLFSVLPIFFAINQLFRLRLFDVTLIDNAYMYFLLGFYLPVVFLISPATPSAPKDRIPWYDAILFGVTALICFYFGLNGLKIVGLGWEYAAPLVPTLLSLLLWALVIEAVRRSADLSLMVTCLIFSLYPLFAYHLPGFLKGQPFDLLTTARLHVMGANGVIGLPFFVLVNLLIGFILFGVILQSSGGGAFFYNLASSLLGQYRGGAAKIGILGSSFFGMLSGSTVSNVVAIGSMTIPAMKRTGFSPHYAAAIESCASAGGPIMPPVMGAAAFIMASFLNVPYYQIAIAAAIPACLYYFGLFIQVDGYAAKTGLKGFPKSELPLLWGTLKQGWFYLGVIVIMCYFLLSLTVEAWAPFYASGALLILTLVKKETRLTWPSTVLMLSDITKSLSQLVAILSAAGLLIGGLTVTGVALSFSRELVASVGSNSLLILIAGALTSFVLGLGMPTTACYIFLAVVMVPALVTLKIDPLGAHLFVFYWGALSDITPPTALCVAAASGIAGSNFMQTGWTAMRLGVVKYLVPFFFVYNAALLTHGPLWDVLLSTLFAVIGVFYLSSALEGYLWGLGILNLTSRILMVAGGLLTAFPELITTLIGLILLVAVTLFNYLPMRGKKRKTKEISDPMR